METDPKYEERHAMLIGGFALLGMGILGVYANFFVLAQLTSSETVLHTSDVLLAAFSFLAIAVLDVIVAWALYQILKHTRRRLAWYATLIRIVYAIILAIASTYLLQAAYSLHTVVDSTAPAEAIRFIETFQNIWSIGLILFGLHLGLIGYLVFRSSFMPRLLGILLVVAGVGYVFDSVLLLIVPGSTISIASFTFIGEIWLLVYLLYEAFRHRGKVQ